MEQRKKADAIKLLERTLKEEKVAEAERSAFCRANAHASCQTDLICCQCRKRTITKERKERQEEKQRLEEAAARMSAKKLQRMKKVSLPHLSRSVVSKCSLFLR